MESADGDRQSAGDLTPTVGALSRVASAVEAILAHTRAMNESGALHSEVRRERAHSSEEVESALILSPIISTHDVCERWKELRGMHLNFSQLFGRDAGTRSNLQEKIKVQESMLSLLRYSEADYWREVAASIGFQSVLVSAQEYLESPGLETRYYTAQVPFPPCALDRRSTLLSTGQKEDVATELGKKDALYVLIDYHRHGLNRSELSGFALARTPVDFVEAWLSVARTRGKGLNEKEVAAWAYVLNNFGKEHGGVYESEETDIRAQVLAFSARMFDFLGEEILQEPLGKINYSRKDGFEKLFTTAEAVHKVGEPHGLTREESLRIANLPKNIPLFMARFKFGHKSSRTEHLKPQDFQWPMTEWSKKYFSDAHRSAPGAFQNSLWLQHFASLRKKSDISFNISNHASYLELIAELDSSATPEDVYDFYVASYLFGSFNRVEQISSQKELLRETMDLKSAGYGSLRDISAVLYMLSFVSTSAKQDVTKTKHSFLHWLSEYGDALAQRGMSKAEVSGLYAITHDTVSLIERYLARPADSRIDAYVREALVLTNTAHREMALKHEATGRKEDKDPHIKQRVLELNTLLGASVEEVPELRLKLSVEMPVRDTMTERERYLAKKYESIKFVGVEPRKNTYAQLLDFLDVFDVGPDMILPFCEIQDGESVMKVSNIDGLLKVLAINSRTTHPQLEFLLRHYLESAVTRIPLGILKEMYMMDASPNEGPHVGKPNALLLMSKDDWNGSLGKRHRTLRKLNKTHNIVVHEFGGAEDIPQLSVFEQEKGRKYQCVILMGHGEPGNITTGIDIERRPVIKTYSISLENTSVFQTLKPVLEHNCAFILDSCEPDSRGVKHYGGKVFGPRYYTTLKRRFAFELPEVRVFASNKKAGLETVVVDPDTHEVLGAEFITK